MSIVFGTPTTATPSTVKLVGDSEGVLPTDRDEGVDAFGLERLSDPVDATIDLVRIRARGAEHRAAPRKAPPHEVDVERHRAILDDTPPPVEEAHELVVVDRLALSHDCSDHRVQSWAVAATGQQSDSHLVHVTRASARLYPAAPMSVIVAIDAGTTGVRAFAVGEDGTPRGWSYREFTQHFPEPGRVEHDASEIWKVTQQTFGELASRLDEPIAAIGITNQRETVVVWDRRTGEPLHRAIVWQDRRTAERCDELRDAGHLDLVRSRTGLVLDPYFSAHEARVDPAVGHDRPPPPMSRSALSTRGCCGS